jgi:hypothetical protein
MGDAICNGISDAIIVGGSKERPCIELYLRDAILRRTMDRALARRAVVIGHLIFTAPAIAALLLVPFLGLRMFGPFLFVYYVLAGVTFGWRWYALVLPGWKRWLARNGVQDEEANQLTHRAGLAWLGEGKIGPFALHTTAAVVCGIYLGPWLLGRWFVWLLPLVGSTRPPTGNNPLQYFEVASVVPAFVMGYVLSLYFRGQATWAWVVPTGVLSYKLLTFTDPYASVLVPHFSTRFSYFFVIQRTMPTFTLGFGGVDPVRVAQQVTVIAPFYAGLAYSIGALAARHNVLQQLSGHAPGVQPESKIDADGENS